MNSVPPRVRLEGWLIISAVATYTAWSILRSYWLGQPNFESMDDFGFWKIFPFVATFAVISIIAARNTVTSIYFMALLAPLSWMPPIPHLPFIREFGHIALWALIVVMVIRSFMPLTRTIKKLNLLRTLENIAKEQDVIFIILFALIVEGVVSTLINYFLSQDVVLLKMGVTYILLGAMFLKFLYLVSSLKTQGLGSQYLLFDAMIISIYVSLGLGAIGVAALFAVEIVPSNDTALGFGYYCRLKSTFFGPVHAGIFYAASLPLLLHRAAQSKFRHEKVLLILLMMACGVLIFATGARSAKAALLMILLGAILYRPYRKYVLMILPFYGVLYYYGLFYRCLVPIEGMFPSKGSGFYPSFVNDFFDDSARVALATHALDLSIQNGVWKIGFLIGFGPGITSASALGFDSHNAIINTLVEYGVLGVLLSITAICLLVWKTAKNIIDKTNSSDVRNLSFSALLSLLPIAVGGMVFDNRAWFYVWWFLALAVALSRSDGGRQNVKFG